MGSPDAFVITVDEVDGVLVRAESWLYYEVATQIDLLDGEILWTVELEPLASGALYPLWFEPAQFDLLASTEDVRSGLADVELEEIGIEDEAFESGLFLAGEQLLLGFVDDQLVYVETFPLVDVDAEALS